MVVVFRTDSSTQIGIGHVIRCLSLADGLRKLGIDCVFVCKNYQGNLLSNIRKKGFKTESLNHNADLKTDLDFTTGILLKYQSNTLITDSYHITDDYQKEIKKKGKLLVCIDDIAHTHFYADILINQNAGVTDKDYQNKVEPYTRLLLGTRYALIRNEFIQYAARERLRHDTNNILVTLGGGDPHNQTLKVLKALNAIRSLPLKIKVISGPGYRYTGELKKYIANNKGKDIEIVENCRKVAEMMCWADLAINGGGSTCWELACLGIPNLIIEMASNQSRCARELDKKGISVNLGWFDRVKEADIERKILELLNNPRKKREMSLKGRQLVDGKGGERVVSQIYKLVNGVRV